MLLPVSPAPPHGLVETFKAITYPAIDDIVTILEVQSHAVDRRLTYKALRFSVYEVQRLLCFVFWGICANNLYTLVYRLMKFI